MGIPVIVAVGSYLTTLSLIVRSVLNFLDRRGDRQLARYIFDQTRSTDRLSGYTELRKAQRIPIVGRRVGNEHEATP